MDYVFLVTLGLTALTGMLTLILRDTSAMGSILVLHLAMHRGVVHHRAVRKICARRLPNACR